MDILQALEEQRVHPEHPLTEEEFLAELGMTPQESAEADEEARKRYPELFA
jgi:hypothetical protein